MAFVAALFVLLAALIYRQFKPKAAVNRFFYSAVAFLLLEILLYGLAINIFQEPFRSFFDIRYAEYNHSSSFSSLLLFVSAITAFSLCFRQRGIWTRFYFLVLSLCFLFLAVDEYFMIHETLPNWEESYASVALLMTGIGAWYFVRSKPQDALIIFLAIFGGMALAATGSIGMEKFFGAACFGWLKKDICAEIPLIEEVLEVLGFIFTASGLCLLQSSRKFISFASGAWLLLLLFSTWLQPMLESQFLAQKTDVSFEVSPISLTAYRLNSESFRAGDTFSLDLYWQTSANVERDYGYTVNLLDPLTGESLWRENLNIAYPATKGWFTGVTYRSHFDFIIPDTIVTPVSPILTIALWRREGETYQSFEGLSASLPIFAEQFPIIDRISLLSPIEEFEPAYRFANGILLAVPELMRENEREYRLNLIWSSEANIAQSYGYFIHFLGEEGQENLIFDRQPFENRFPTNLWRMGMVEADVISLSLPETSRGNYRVQMGLFDGTNRLDVSDMAGNALPEQSIPLGRVAGD